MIDRLIPEHPLARRAAAFAATALALLLFTQFVFPGARGGGRGTPAAILFQGLVLGLVVAVFATAVVLVYRTMRFVNFIIGPLGTGGVILLSYLLFFTNVPFPVALLAMLLMSATVGAIFGVFLLRFFNSSRLYLTVVTIVGAQFLVFGVFGFIARLPFWPSPDKLTAGQQRDLSRLPDLLPFQGLEFRVGRFPDTYGFEHVFAIEVAVLTLLAVVVFLRYTRLGTAVRAMAENPERASLLGIGVGGLSVVVWTIAGMLDGIGATLAEAAAPALQGSGDFTSIFRALLFPVAAAVMGRFRHLGTTIFAAVLIGVSHEAWVFSFRRDTGLFFVVLLGIVSIGLLAQRRHLVRSEAAAAVTWATADEPRPVPKELAGVPGLRRARWALAAIGVVVVLVFPFAVGGGRVVLAGVVALNAIAVLSLVVLTGWAGQVSLGQYALVAVGSVVGGSLTARVGVPFWVAVPLTAAIVAGVAVLVGLPALRVRGLFLLVSTFAFAVAVHATLFNDRYFGWLLPEEVDRPTLFFIDFESERAMYYLTVAALLLAIVVVVNLRRSRVGRLLIALRESEANVQSFGVSPVRLKLLALAVSGGLAGFAGVIFSHHARGVSQDSFSPFESLSLFTAAVLGGVTSVGGALLGSAYIELSQEFASGSALVMAIFRGVGPLVIVFMAPGGFISLVNAARDSVLRIVAQRRQIIVPSLFADYDPEVLERRLIPLGEPGASGGLAALPADRRYALASELYKGPGERIVDRLAPKREARETAALGAAARRAEESEGSEAQPALAVPEAAS